MTETSFTGMASVIPEPACASLGLGALVLAPSLIYLFRVFKREPADQADPSFRSG